MAVTVDIFFADTSATGHYYYNAEGEQLSLAGSVKKQHNELKEITDTSVTGYLQKAAPPKSDDKKKDEKKDSRPDDKHADEHKPK